MSEATTRGVLVSVTSRYLPERSDPRRAHYVHAYRVTIRNQSDVAVTLLSRHWIITNGLGTEEHVRGAGVVGEQPRIEPGASFQYTSGAPLDTAVGTMHGSYRMQLDNGELFDAVVAPFTLAEPYALN